MKTMTRRPRIALCALTISCMIVSTLAPSFATQTSEQPQPEVRLVGTNLEWSALDRPTRLNVSGPSGTHATRVFEANEASSFDLLELGAPGLLEDGVYRFELRVLGLREESEEALASLLPAPSRGALSVAGGVARLEAEKLPGRANPTSGETSAGLHFITSEVLTDSNGSPRIHLNDTTADDDDWWIFADLPTDDDFSIFFESESGPTSYPFQITQDTNTSALVIEGSGTLSSADIGINTSTPAVGLHLAEPIPRLRFEDSTQPAIWQITADSLEFSIADVTNGRTSFRLDTAAPTNSLFIASSGNLGLGTSNPQGDLHIFGSSSDDVFSGVGPNLLTGPALNFGYAGSSFGLGSGFFNVRPAAGAVAPNPALYFATNNIERMVIDNVGHIGVDLDATPLDGFDPQHPIHAQKSGARLTAAGIWTNASSRSLKADIEPLGLTEATAALRGLEPVKYHYRIAPEDPQVGFIAEDVPDLVATPDRTTLAPTDIVGVLTRVVQSQQELLEELRQVVSAQARRIEALESSTDE